MSFEESKCFGSFEEQSKYGFFLGLRNLFVLMMEKVIARLKFGLTLT